MSRITLNLSRVELSLLNRLAEANAQAAVSSLRLSTGQKINYPSDDPTGFQLLASLQSEISLASAAATNATTAGTMVSQAQDTIADIRTQLNLIRTELISDEGGALSPEQLAEAQSNIDAAIAEIADLASSQIQGRRLLDGSAAFTVSGENSSQVRDVQVYSTPGGTHTIQGTVASTATQATKVYTGTAANQIVNDATFTLAGPAGSYEFSVTAGEALSDVADRINDMSHRTGVTASVDAVSHELTFTTVKYGSNATITITEATPGTFTTTGTGVGTDAQATIQGETLTGDGNRFTYNRNGLHLEIEFVAGFTGSFDDITVSGEALTFALWPDAARKSTLALPSLLPSQLGGLSGRLDQLASGGSLVIGTATSQAIRVVDEALAQVEKAEGLADGFYNSAVTTATNYLSDLQDNLQDAVDAINEVDDEEESQRLSLYQDLATNAVSALAILQQQRSSLVTLIQQAAGLI